ncbi:hypothetical protein [Microbacterium sp. JB110]|uniref:hypothetical protein n=1 Tax=Microbacterium sp. JB110 TaxID=2024477 RepID=UPI0011C05208|nr:hypothetical protein [Microbacterium sp. JB110]
MKFHLRHDEPDKVMARSGPARNHYTSASFRRRHARVRREPVRSGGIAVEPGVLPARVVRWWVAARHALDPDQPESRFRTVRPSGTSGGRAARLHARELLDGVVRRSHPTNAGAAFSRVSSRRADGRIRGFSTTCSSVCEIHHHRGERRGAAAVRAGTPTDELGAMSVQAQAFGSERLSRTELVSANARRDGVRRRLACSSN